MNIFTEKMIQNVVFIFPSLLNIKEDIEPFEKEKRIEKLRCDAIFKVKNKEEFILLEIKKNNANYTDIGQVMEYYSLLIKKGYNITKVCLLAKYFEEGLLTALRYCGIEALTYESDSIKSAINSGYSEEREGIYLEPKFTELSGYFPKLYLEDYDEDYATFILDEYENYQNEFYNKPQHYLLEIWEFTISRGNYVTSIKHKGEAIHPFNKTFGYMASKLRTNSSRFAVWNYFQNNYNGIPYNKIKVWTYNPERPNRLAQSEYNESDFINECVPNEYRKKL